MADHVAEEAKQTKQINKCPVSLESVEQAVKALFFTLNAESKAEPVKKKTKRILDDDDENRIFLVINTHKIQPGDNSNSMVSRIRLPHSIYTENTRICLFVKDGSEKRDEEGDAMTKQTIKDLLRITEVGRIDEIMPLHQLGSEFKTYECKRNLCLSYDLFLSDQRISRYLPSLLGREFFKRRRKPLSINMTAPDLKKQFENVLKSTVLYQNNQGASKNVLVALTTFDEASAVANVYAAIEQLDKCLLGGWANLRRLHIRSHNSMTIPIYVSTDSGNDVSIVMPSSKGVPAVTDDLPTRLNSKVTVYPDGTVKVIEDPTKPDGAQLVDDSEPLMRTRQRRVLKEKDQKMFKKLKTGLARRGKKKRVSKFMARRSKALKNLKDTKIPAAVK